MFRDVSISFIIVLHVLLLLFIVLLLLYCCHSSFISFPKNTPKTLKRSLACGRSFDLCILRADIDLFAEVGCCDIIDL